MDTIYEIDKPIHRSGRRKTSSVNRPLSVSTAKQRHTPYQIFRNSKATDGMISPASDITRDINDDGSQSDGWDWDDDLNLSSGEVGEGESDKENVPPESKLNQNCYRDNDDDDDLSSDSEDGDGFGDDSFFNSEEEDDTSSKENAPPEYSKPALSPNATKIREKAMELLMHCPSPQPMQQQATLKSQQRKTNLSKKRLSLPLMPVNPPNQNNRNIPLQQARTVSKQQLQQARVPVHRPRKVQQKASVVQKLHEELHRELDIKQQVGDDLKEIKVAARKFRMSTSGQTDARFVSPRKGAALAKTLSNTNTNIRGRYHDDVASKTNTNSNYEPIHALQRLHNGNEEVDIKDQVEADLEEIKEATKKLANMAVEAGGEALEALWYGAWW